MLITIWQSALSSGFAQGELPRANAASPLQHEHFPEVLLRDNSPAGRKEHDDNKGCNDSDSDDNDDDRDGDINVTDYPDFYDHYIVLLL